MASCAPSRKALRGGVVGAVNAWQMVSPGRIIDGLVRVMKSVRFDVSSDTIGNHLSKNVHS